MKEKIKKFRILLFDMILFAVFISIVILTVYKLVTN